MLLGTILITLDAFSPGVADAVQGVADQLVLNEGLPSSLTAIDGAPVVVSISADVMGHAAGDAAIVLSALFYSIATFRISVIAPGAVLDRV